MSSPVAFRYRALDPSGRVVEGEIAAPDRAAAARLLAQDKLTAFALDPIATQTASGRATRAKLADRLMIARQLSILLQAGVPLLSALETLARAFPRGELALQLNAAMKALRQGEPLGAAFRTHVPGFPAYAYALLEAGEQTGRLPEVLGQTADQMAFEDRLGRDVRNALAYPAFLAIAGVLSVAFLFYEVVPRFTAMIGEDRSGLPLVSRFVFDAGDFVRANGLFLLAGLAVLVLLGRTLLGAPEGKAFFSAAARAIPVVGAILKARDLASWSRLMGFALSSGVALLPAMRLARAGVTAPPFEKGLQEAERALRGGADVDEALTGNAPLSAMDLSLVRTGQRSGALGPMFLLMADTHEADVRDAVKRATALIEPIALAFIALAVGTIAVSLALALSSVYDRVG